MRKYLVKLKERGITVFLNYGCYTLVNATNSNIVATLESSDAVINFAKSLA